MLYRALSDTQSITLTVLLNLSVWLSLSVFVPSGNLIYKFFRNRFEPGPPIKKVGNKCNDIQIHTTKVKWLKGFYCFSNASMNWIYQAVKSSQENVPTVSTKKRV